MFLCGSILVLFYGCATVRIAPSSLAQEAKKFVAPEMGQAGLYVYRDGIFGSILKKDIWVDGECLGESAPKVFFFMRLPAGKHTIATESEFSPNALSLDMESGKNYFVRQYIKVGVFVGGANLKLVDEEKGRVAVAKLKMAEPGHCSDPHPK
ncbi:DUF2846 domain-containing protein [Helicobacter mehlei]|uniref:DUF2846 domain-containing protein n=1 Tax=Helicobacter mehlei TaxID=2316080 RepID=A0A553V0R0_9HELI|nr:DUF2846 domain-containing protein [Helicobacter mehlei]